MCVQVGFPRNQQVLVGRSVRGMHSQPEGSATCAYACTFGDEAQAYVRNVSQQAVLTNFEQ